MKKFNDNGFTVKLTNKNISIEIPISNLVNAFNLSPENYNESTIKRGKRQEFAECMAKIILEETDQDTGNNLIASMFDQAFESMMENGEDFIKFNDEEDDNE